MKVEKEFAQRSTDFEWPFWPIVPLYPYGERQTLCEQVLENQIWTFDQLQGTLQVIVPIRMTVVKLAAGGLFVYAPVAPTPECIRLLQQLIKVHGEIKYIVLPTVSGIEHKVFVPPFARKFPQAQIYVIPNQWSFPVNLPLSWLGFPPNRTHLLPQDSRETPFAEEFDYAILKPISLGLGSFSEAVFFHKPSKTLLVNDLLVSVPAEPPGIIQKNPYSLLFHAKDDVFDVVVDSPASRRKGWQRICLLALYIQPNALKITGFLRSLQDSFKAPDRSPQAYFGLYPFQWNWNWQESFEILAGNGRLLVAPILQQLILNRDPQNTCHWVEKVASWPLQRVIASHFDSPVGATGEDLRQAFAFVNPRDPHPTLPPEEFKCLKQVDEFLIKTKITPPPLM